MSKHTVRYWESRVLERPGIAGLQVRFQIGRKQVWFPLNTGERQAAAETARDIFLSLQTNGLEKTLAKYKPKSVKPIEVPKATLGEWLAAARPIMIGARCSPFSWERYRQTIRHVAAEIAGLPDGPQRSKTLRKAWWEKVDATPLASLTNDAIKNWMRKKVDEAVTNPASLASVKRNMNFYRRTIKSVFGSRIRKELPNIPLPNPPPGEDLPLYDSGSFRYFSKVNILLLLTAARNALREANEEAYKVFLLALFAGLRRHEIDLLEWAHMDWGRSNILLCETELLSLKTDSSTSEVNVPDDIMLELRSFMPKSTSKFVITASGTFKLTGHRLEYRCQKVFDSLIDWMREHGVSDPRPLHMLRKEGGSLVNSEHGIFAAQQFLRHANIGTTSSHYVDKRKRYTVSLGSEGAVGGVAAPAEGKQNTENLTT